MRRLFALTLIILTTGCGQAMSDFASGARRLLPIASEPPAQESPKGAGLFEGRKFSNGTVNAKGNEMGMTVTVSPTQKTMKGSSFGMRVGISRGSDGHRER